MTASTRSSRNQRVRAELTKELEAMAPGKTVVVSEIAIRYSNGNRRLTGHNIGNLLRELDIVRRIGGGVWERVAP